MSQGLERGTESHRACVVSETALCFVSLEPDGFTQPCGSPQVTSTLGRPVCRSAVGPFVLACTPTVDLCSEQRQSSPPSSPASGRDRLCPQRARCLTGPWSGEHSGDGPLPGVSKCSQLSEGRGAGVPFQV